MSTFIALSGYLQKAVRPLLGFGLVFTLLLGSNSYADSYTQGVSAYKMGDNSKAISYFKNAVKDNPNNAKAIFYMGLAYAKMGQNSNARQAFDTVIHMVDDNDPLAAKARNNVAYITNEQMVQVSNSGKAATVIKSALKGGENNYLAHVLPNGAVVHFDQKRMPLKVFVGTGSGIAGWTSDMNNAVYNAMSTWTKASGSRIRFVTTTSIDNADIVVSWQRNFSEDVVGVSPLQVSGGTIVSSDVNLAVYSASAKAKIPTSMLNGVAIHEFGHALGIRGHSPYKEDIMYYSMNDRQTNTVSSRDTNTLNMLYKVEADVKNTIALSPGNTKKYFDLVEKGRLYYKAGNSAAAIAVLRQALQISTALPDARYTLAIILYNQGNTLIKTNSFKQAQTNYTEALSHLQSVSTSTNKMPGVTSNELAEFIDACKNNLFYAKMAAAKAS